MSAVPGPVRLTSVMSLLSISSSSWFRRSKATTATRGRPSIPLDPSQVAMIRALAVRYPYWGYKRLAVLARREFGSGFSDLLTYRIMSSLGLLQRRIPYQAELHQTRQLFELLVTAPNGLWQMDVTYVHVPQGQWWYIVSVIDYYSRYLLTCSLTPFQNATAVSQALSKALQEAERLHGPLPQTPTQVTIRTRLGRVLRNFANAITRYVHIGLYDRQNPQSPGLPPKCMNKVDPSLFQNGRNGRKPQGKGLKNSYKLRTESGK